MKPVRSVAGYRWLIGGLFILLALSCLISLGFGSARVPLAKVLGIVLQQAGFDSMVD